MPQVTDRPVGFVADTFILPPPPGNEAMGYVQSLVKASTLKNINMTVVTILVDLCT